MNRLVLGLLCWVMAAGVHAAEKPTFHDCKLVNHFGSIVHIVYCPASISADQLSEFTLATKSIWLQRYNMVQYRFFSTQTGLPNSHAAVMGKSDEWFEKYEIGLATFNTATGLRELWRKEGSEMVDYSRLLK